MRRALTTTLADNGTEEERWRRDFHRLPIDRKYGACAVNLSFRSNKKVLYQLLLRLRSEPQKVVSRRWKFALDSSSQELVCMSPRKRARRLAKCGYVRVS